MTGPRGPNRGVRTRTLPRVGYACVVLLGVLLFWEGATTHAEKINRTPRAKDQGAYLLLGNRIARTNGISVDGARSPLYPAFLALLHEKGLTKQEYFERARTWNVMLVLACWLAFLLVLQRWLRPLTALVAWLASGFTLWMFFAPYVKAEGVFYLFSTLSFMLMLRVLWRPRPRTALLAGVVTGVGYLLKASLGPALLLFSVVQVLAAGAEYRRWYRRGPSAERPVGALWRRVTSVPIVIVAFLLTVSPYLAANHAVFGRCFYNVNSDFYVWYDSWAESGRGTRGHGDRKGWPDLPEEEIPSAGQYWREHSMGHILRRIERGSKGLLRRATTDYGFGALALVALLGGATAAVRSNRLRWWLARRWYLGLFCIAYFTGYFLLCAWFHAIHPGLRFLAALAPPALLVGSWLADREASRSPIATAKLFPLMMGLALALSAPEIAARVRTFASAGW